MNNKQIKNIEELIQRYANQYTCSIPINNKMPVFFKNKVSYVGRSLEGLVNDMQLVELNLDLLVESWNNNEFTIVIPKYIWFCNKFSVNIKNKLEFLTSGEKPEYLYLEPLKRKNIEVKETESLLLEKFKDVEEISFVENTIQMDSNTDLNISVHELLVKWELKGLIKFMINKEYVYHSYEEANYDYLKMPMKHHIFSEPEMKYFRIVLTEECDLNCVYCYYADNKFVKRRIMAKEKLFETIDYILYLCQQRERKSINIQWWGGDPAANENLVIEGTEYAKKIFKDNNIVVNFFICSSFVSNNTEAFFDYIIENNFNITISLDGDKELNNLHKLIKHKGKNSFDTTMESYIYMQKKIGEINSFSHEWKNNFNGTLKFRSTLFSKDEIKRYPEIENFFYKFNQSFRICTVSDSKTVERKKVYTPELINAVKRAQSKVINNYINKESKENLLPIFLNAHTNPLSGMKFVYSRCGFGGGLIIINPDGEMFTCHRFCDINDFCIGKIGENYETLVANIKKFRDRWLLLYDKCKECSKQSICSGGCAHEAYEKYSSIWKTSSCVSEELIKEKMLLLYLFERCYPDLLKIKLKTEDCSNVRGVWC